MKDKPKQGSEVGRADPAALRHLQELTNPRRWDELSPFRESFLRYFTIPEQRRVFREIGHLLYQMVLDAVTSWPASSAPFPEGELKALGRDLRYAESYLASIARTLLESDSPSAADLRVAKLLTRECQKVRKVALRIEKVKAPAGAKV